MLKRQSIQLKYTLMFLLTVALIGTAVLPSLYNLRTKVLRNEAQAIANQVVSFRSWVAKSGMVWVDSLSEDFHDFLAKRDSEAGNAFYGKNPALATRELSDIVNNSAIRATFRVTSDEYRHPENQPDPFEVNGIRALQQDGELNYVDGFEKDQYRYLQPIFVKKACLKCHGDPSKAPKEVIEKYGDKRAFGYKIGDVRGVISVKIPDITIAEVLPTLLNPTTVVLIIAAFLLNFLYVQFGLIQRLKSLTKNTEAIASGSLDRKLEYHHPKNSKDEVDHLNHAVHVMRSSLQEVTRKARREELK